MGMGIKFSETVKTITVNEKNSERVTWYFQFFIYNVKNRKVWEFGRISTSLKFFIAYLILVAKLLSFI